ncbi:recombinase family protein [Bacteroides timonensis]|uniref:recombinase family protein n=1 Tax=Bacteroides timonensis TaxID=1470345 RepID=UPI0004AC8AE0|nr:recombinase family protein [Bacteroides timonensis]
MSKVGYIMLSSTNDRQEEDLKSLETVGCKTIIQEREEDEVSRPKWRKLMISLDRNDTLVIIQFRNAVRGTRELATLLDFCREANIRIISLRDRIDSEDLMFPASTANIFNVIGRLPQDIFSLRKASSRLQTLRRRFSAKESQERNNRNQRIVELYLGGYSIDEIRQETNIHSKGSLYRILKEKGVETNRRNQKKN